MICANNVCLEASIVVNSQLKMINERTLKCQSAVDLLCQGSDERSGGSHFHSQKTILSFRASWFLISRHYGLVQSLSCLINLAELVYWVNLYLPEAHALLQIM